VTVRSEQVYYSGDTLNETLHFKDADGEYFDPDSIDVTVRDPDGTVMEEQDEDNLTQEDTGQWILTYDLPADSDSGEWSYTVKAVYGTVTNSEIFQFYVNLYGQLSNVRDLCGISDDSYDYSLLNQMCAATIIINEKLTNKQTTKTDKTEYNIPTTPFDQVPSIVHVIANLYASGLYLQRNSPDEKDHPYIRQALNLIDEYLSKRVNRENRELPKLM